MPLTGSGVPSRAAIQAAIDEVGDHLDTTTGVVTYGTNTAAAFGGSTAYKVAGVVIVQVVFQATAAVAAGETVLTLPVGFRPAVTVNDTLARNGSTEALGVYTAFTGAVAPDRGLTSGQIFTGKLVFPAA